MTRIRTLRLGAALGMAGMFIAPAFLGCSSNEKKTDQAALEDDSDLTGGEETASSADIEAAGDQVDSVPVAEQSKTNPAGEPVIEKAVPAAPAQAAAPVSAENVPSSVEITPKKSEAAPQTAAAAVASVAAVAGEEPSPDAVRGVAAIIQEDAAPRPQQRPVALRNPSVNLERKPFERAGALLNAFYVVRGEGSWIDLAQRIYRDPVRADDIKNWNPDLKIAPGAIAYYRSALRPNDAEAMKMFHDDFGYMAEKYSVQKGETLKKIAEGKLGSSKYWAEIALANPGLTRLNALPQGTEILLPPNEVDNGAKLEQLAQAQLEEQRQRRLEAEKQKQLAQAPVPAPTPTEASRAPASAPEQAPVEATSKWTAMVENLPVPPAVIGGALAVLGGGIFLLRRRSASG